jgi:hypothetical protein
MGQELLWHCTQHDDQNPSLDINLRKNCWMCGPCGKSGNAWELSAFLAGCDPSDKPRVAAFLQQLGPLSPNGSGHSIVATYDYTDEKDELLYQVVRREPKGFTQRRPDGHGGWIPSLNGVRRVLYGLPEVLNASSVLIVEGEKDVETARKMHLTATCNSGGAGKWKAEFSECLRGKDITVIPDNEKAGLDHARAVVASLVPVAESVKLLRLPNGKDLTEWNQGGGSREGLLALIEATKVLTQADVVGWARSTVGRTPDIVCLADVQPEEVNFLWNPYIALGKVTLLEGDPSVGKTYVALKLCAELTCDAGEMIEHAAANVLYMTAEDGLADTLRPRFDLMGGDASRFHVLRGVLNESKNRASITLADVDVIGEALRDTQALLVVVDPLQDRKLVARRIEN